MKDDELPLPIRAPVVIGEAGGLVDESKVTLVLYAEDLDPDEVSRLLGTQPTHAHRRGERGRVTGVPRKRGCWGHSVEAKAPMGPDDLIRVLLARFPGDPDFWSRLRDAYDVTIVVGLFQNRWNRGFELRAETIALVARTGAAVEFDIYCDQDE